MRVSIKFRVFSNVFCCLYFNFNVVICEHFCKWTLILSTFALITRRQLLQITLFLSFSTTSRSSFPSTTCRYDYSLELTIFSKTYSCKVNEYLTKTRSNLLYKLRSLCKNYSTLTSVYSLNGNIYYKTVSSEKPVARLINWNLGYWMLNYKILL